MKKLFFYRGTGITDVQSNPAIQISPNPVAESFCISGITENTAITVLDMSGKTVLQCIVAPMNPCLQQICLKACMLFGFQVKR